MREVVEPRAGRCVLFASGYEHLHRVCPVASGCRFVLATWFTLAPASGATVPPAHYDMVDPVPPPAADDLKHEGTTLDALREGLDRMIAQRQAAAAGGARRPAPGGQDRAPNRR